MKRIHKVPSGEFVSSGGAQGLLTNGFGGYFCYHDTLSYRGWYLLYAKEWRMQKIIESITPLDEGDVESFYNQLYGLRRVFSSGAEDMVMMYQKVLLYSTVKMSGRVKITFDHRQSYDLSKMGRHYEVTFDGDYALISFKNDEGYSQYVGIRGIKSPELLDSWREVNYPEDEKRHAESTYWVYDALTFIPTAHVVMSAASSPGEARTLADIAYYHFDEITSNVHTRTIEDLPSFDLITSNNLRAAATSASWSLQSLHQYFTFDHNLFNGIYAGLPWFFQVWSRDELISLGGLLEIVKQTKNIELLRKIKSILDRHVLGILKNGQLQNRFPHSDLGSVDSFGWLARRIIDFLQLAKREKHLFTIISVEELIMWFEKIRKGIESAHLENNLYPNGFNETWMDTSYQDDGRAGYRIEIQALYSCVYDCLIYIGKLIDSPFTLQLKKKQQQLRHAIRSKFIRENFEGYVIDGFNERDDRSFRPNIFLAAYVSPELFTRAEWKKIFEAYTKKLFSPWGGLTTIEKTHHLFQPHYTGQDNHSYHRGDSWYFVNNIAAIVLHRLGVQPYIVTKIADASARDILDEGLAGHGSEVSCAAGQTPDGCLAQAWSVATYIELMGELYPFFD